MNRRRFSGVLGLLILTGCQYFGISEKQPVPQRALSSAEVRKPIPRPGVKFAAANAANDYPIKVPAAPEKWEMVWTSEMMDIDDPVILKLEDSIGPELLASDETVEQFERESHGTYLSTEKRLKTCRKIPVDVVWREFAPFFDYRWDEEFEEFAALFLAIWQRESGFASPSTGVHVNPNCNNRMAKIVKPLPGREVSTDLGLAREKDELLSRYFGASCDMDRADFGPLQWSHKWRLSSDLYRPTIERALLLASAYKAGELAALSMQEVAALIKYNPKALFILGGLDLRQGIRQPTKTISLYNPDPAYRRAVDKDRRELLDILRGDHRCSPVVLSKDQHKGKRGI